MEKRYIIALDEGTTSLRSILYDTKTNEIVHTEQMPFKQFYPKTGWVEQDATEIWNSQKKTLDDLLQNAKISQNEILGIGITNQRETVVAWDKTTGNPIYRAIVWQCRRTAKYIESLPKNIVRKIKNKTGLIADAYFSASKMKWIIDNVPKAKELLDKKQLCIGTIDSYLAFKLTGKFVTDTTNASRTMLFNIDNLDWDSDLLNYFNIPRHALADVVSCNDVIGKCLDYNFELCGIIGDQQASLFGQACLRKGMTKATYGTGCFILMNTGEERVKSKTTLCTIGYTINGRTIYALEGSVFSACNAINWLKYNLNLYDDVRETSDICNSIPDNDGVYFVPAFTGLGAPYWDSFAKGSITGMTLATNKAHIIRACIESIAYNTYSIIRTMADRTISVKELHVDGGGSKNEFLLQFQSNMIQRNVIKSYQVESTALGAIYMVALAKKIMTMQDITKLYKVKNIYKPAITRYNRDNLFTKWEDAVATTLYHAKRSKK
ncbi:MAG: glycerol kinase GlpK [Clostridiales bacterium]|nr:glycerol kinase GlpK [Clostridiales bacterium]